MYKGTLFAGFILVLLLVAACGEIVPTFSTTPEISFNSITRKAQPDGSDSLIISLGFRDGDGNLGDSNPNGTSNIFITPFKRYQGRVIPLVFSEPTPPFDGILPLLKTDTKPGPIEGTILYRILLFATPEELLTTPDKDIRQGDIISFQIRIIDNDGNVSNTITTEEVKVLQ